MLGQVKYTSCILLTKRDVKMAGYWPSSLLAFLWTETRSIKTQKVKEANNQFSGRNSLVNKRFIIWHATPSCRFLFLLLNSLGFVEIVFLKLINIFVFFFSFALTPSVLSFSSSILTEKSRKIFLLSRKILCERKLLRRVLSSKWFFKRFFIKQTVTFERDKTVAVDGVLMRFICR